MDTGGCFGATPALVASLPIDTPGVLDNQSQLFVHYDAQLTFRDKLLGGVPKDPKLIEGWLRAKAGLESGQELRRALLRTLSELGLNASGETTSEDLIHASEELVARRLTTGFKRGEQGLYIEARQIKALLKECTNILFAAERWGPTRKGPKSFLAERVFVQPDRVWLGTDAPDGLEQVVGHLSGPTGPVSTLGYHEYVVRPTLTFSVWVVRDLISASQWADVWVLAQEIGLGAVRSQGHGRFQLTRWSRED
jgi:hypothetical protein